MTEHKPRTGARVDAIIDLIDEAFARLDEIMVTITDDDEIDRRIGLLPVQGPSAQGDALMTHAYAAWARACVADYERIMEAGPPVQNGTRIGGRFTDLTAS